MNPQVKNMIKIVKNQSVFTSIHLSMYDIEEFPFELFDIPRLKKIDLAYNNISEIPKEISKLNNIEEINLRSNRIKIIPKELVFLPNLKKIEISDNPLVEPPIEIASRGLEAIRNYYYQIEDEKVKVYEAKLLIVGEGAVGKTTLMHRLINNEFNEGISTTEGIEIKEFKLKVQGVDNFKINLWDFGGQEIYHATHQFFLTKRSLYLLVWDSIKEDNYKSFDYWLNVINLLSNASPVLIVQNKIDKRLKNLDELTLTKYYPNIIGFHKVSAKENTGIEQLVKLIKKEVFKLDHIGDALPKAWIDIRVFLESLNKNYLDFDEYIKICKEYNLDYTSSLFLSQYYHDLGVFLHFQEHPILKEIIFLKPEWATNSVYLLTDTKEIIDNYGQFSFADLENYWSKYPKEKYIYLIELMKKFELCFEIDDNKKYIIPELLPESIEDICWNYEENINFQYHYKFMPKAILTRFIVLNHHLIHNETFWKNGVVISYENSQAFLINDYFNKKVSVYIKGSNKAEILGIIRKDMSYIHSTLNYPEVTEMISCCCKECRDSNNPHLFNYLTLRKFQSKGKSTIECLKSIEDVDINNLLGYFSPNDQEQELIKDIYELIKNLSNQYKDVVTIKEHLNKYVMLQPNFFGIGLNINKIIEDVIKKKTNS
jgi:small GTP-binding protein